MKVLRVIAASILIIFFQSILCWAIIGSMGSANDRGMVTRALISFAQLPELIIEVKESILEDELIFVDRDETFTELNKLDYDLYGLTSLWNGSAWSVQLFNFRTDSTLYSWQLPYEHIKPADFWNPTNIRPVHTLLLENGSIVVNYQGTTNLLNYDSANNLEWANREMVYHHSMELDHEGNIWICARDSNINKLHPGKGNSSLINFSGQEIIFRDEYIVKIDSRTGEMLYKQSIFEVLEENGYASMLYNKIGHEVDPLHVNDIQPALFDGAYWAKGDLFISLRNLNMILLYRPSTGKILWYKRNHFISQHDVDIISPHAISVFNNNYVFPDNPVSVDVAHHNRDKMLSSELLIYDFKSDSMRTVYKKLFIEEDIATRSEGLAEILPNGDVFVEEQNECKMFILSGEGIVLRKYFETTKPDKVQFTNWVRIIRKRDVEQVLTPG